MVRNCRLGSISARIVFFLSSVTFSLCFFQIFEQAAQAETGWRKIVLENAGVVSIPHSHKVLDHNSLAEGESAGEKSNIQGLLDVEFNTASGKTAGVTIMSLWETSKGIRQPQQLTQMEQIESSVFILEGFEGKEAGKLIQTQPYNKGSQKISIFIFEKLLSTGSKVRLKNTFLTTKNSSIGLAMLYYLDDETEADVLFKEILDRWELELAKLSKI